MNVEEATRAAEALLSEGRWGQALDAWRDVVFARLEEARKTGADFDARDLATLERLADVAVPCGHGEAAGLLFKAAAQLCEQAENRPSADYFRIKQLHIAISLGAIEEAFEAFDRLALSPCSIHEVEFSEEGLLGWERSCRWPSPDRLDPIVLKSRLYLELGRLSSVLGQYGQTIAACRRGRELIAEVESEAARAAALPLLLTEAGARLERGELDLLPKLLHEAEGRINETGAPGFAAVYAELAAKASLMRGELQSARELLERVCEICRRTELIRGFAQASLGLAQALLYLNKSQEARPHIDDAGRLAGLLSDEGLALACRSLDLLCRARSASLLTSVGSVKSAWAGDADGGLAEPHHSDMEDPEQNTNHLAWFEDRSLAFQWRLAAEDWDGAEERLEEMREDFAAADSALIDARLRCLTGVLRYYQGRLGEAEAALTEAAACFEAAELLPDLWQALRVLAWCSDRLGRSHSESIDRRAQAVLNRMTGSLSLEDQVYFLLNKWTADERYIAAELKELAAMQSELDGRPWYRRLGSRWRFVKRLDALQRHVSRLRGARIGAEERTERAAPRPLWKRLLFQRRDEVQLGYIVLPDRLAAIESRWLHRRLRVSSISRPRIRELVRKLHQAIPAFAEGSREEAAGELAEALGLGPTLGGLPKRVHRLRLMPDDALFGLPFACLRVGGAFLIESFEVSMALGLAGERAAGEARAERALIAGVAKGHEAVPPLEQVPEELAEVEGWLEERGVEVVSQLDDAVRRGPFERALAEVGFAHIACHGNFDLRSFESTGLVFLPEGEMEIFGLPDVARLELSGLRHISLSSCWGADNYVSPSRWVTSLAESLCRSGAGSVLACLWPIEDTAARPFMMSFYRHLETRPRAGALAATQQEFLNSEERSSPFYWAGFQLCGQPGPLRLGGPS